MGDTREQRLASITATVTRMVQNITRAAQSRDAVALVSAEQRVIGFCEGLAEMALPATGWGGARE